MNIHTTIHCSLLVAGASLLAFAGCEIRVPECDDGLMCATDMTCAADQNICVKSCGDGVVQADEVCDDGNVRAGDGCPSDCSCGADWQLMNRFGDWAFLHIWGASVTDLYAVGGVGALSPSTDPATLLGDSMGGVVHYDGHRWTQVVGDVPGMTSVWGTGSNDVFAVGVRSTVLRYDGLAWTHMELGFDAHLASVWGTGPSDVFAVGLDGVILHYDGASWSQQASPTTNHLIRVWGTEAGDVFAVGDRATILRYQRARDGTGTWQKMTLGSENSSATVTGIWGTGSDNLYASVSHERVFHYDGNPELKWTAIAEYGGRGDLGFVNIWGTGTDDVFAMSWTGTLARFDGQSWTKDDTAPPFSSMWSKTPQDVFAVDLDGRIWHQARRAADKPNVNTRTWINALTVHPDETLYAVGNTKHLHRFDGSTWQTISPSAGEHLLAVWASESGDVYAVGEHGAIMRYTVRDPAGVLPRRWRPLTGEPEDAGTGKHLRGVWGRGDVVYAVGHGGVIARRDASGRWTRIDSGTNADLWGIWGTASGAVYTVGENNTILHLEPGNDVWRPMVVDGFGGVLFRAVWGSGDGDVFAVGHNGSVYHYDGNPEGRWRPMQVDCSSGDDFRAVWGTGPSDVYVVSEFATAFHYNGEYWTRVRLVHGLAMHAVTGLPSGDVVFAGDDGGVRIMRTDAR